MKQLTITASPRETSGSAAAGRLRASGKVPAVVYGKSKEPTNLTVDSVELRVLLKEIGNSTPLVQLKEEGGEARTSILQEVQIHPLTDKYLHVDFHEVADDEKITVLVPVHEVGEAFGVKNENGTLEVVSHAVHVRCTAKQVPAFIEADVSDLKLGENLHVSDLAKIDGVEYTDNPSQPVFAVVK